MKISPKKLVPLTTLVFLLSISLATAFRSIQAEAGSTPREKISSGDSYGDNYGKLSYQGQQRTYYLYTPKSYNPDRPMPLVLVFHGHEGSGRSIAQVSRFNDLAEKNGFIVVYPDGNNSNWYLRGNLSGKDDDVSFVTALIDQIQRTRNIDSRRIYAAGFSKGAIFAQDLACELPDRIAAFASVAGSIPVWLEPKCQPKTPVSLLMINGTNDLSVRYQGDVKSQKGALISVPETINFWRSHNQCASPAKVQQLPNSNPRERFKVNISRYSGCRGDSEVILAAIVNGGHLWPGGASQDASVNQFNAQLGFNASQTIWDFFQRHTLP